MSKNLATFIVVPDFVNVVSQLEEVLTSETELELFHELRDAVGSFIIGQGCIFKRTCRIPPNLIPYKQGLAKFAELYELDKFWFTEEAAPEKA